jgi:hypothetical protein
LSQEVSPVAVGPVEIVTIGFEKGNFQGLALEELAKVVAAGTITLIDGVVIHKIGEHDFEIAELTEVPELGALVAVASRIDGLVNEDDVDQVASDLPIGSAAAVLVFEHTWVIPLRDALAAAGGTLIDTVQIPGYVVQEVLDAMASEGEE